MSVFVIIKRNSFSSSKTSDVWRHLGKPKIITMETSSRPRTRHAAELGPNTFNLLKFTCMSSYFTFRNHSQNYLKLHISFFPSDYYKKLHVCNLHKHYSYMSIVEETECLSLMGWMVKIMSKGLLSYSQC